MSENGEEERLMTRKEVASFFRVGTRTITAWVAKGKLPVVKTPGGKPRFRESEIRAALNAEEDEPPTG